MPAAERRARLTRLREKIEAWTAEHWLSAQLEALNLKRSADAGETALPVLERHAA